MIYFKSFIYFSLLTILFTGCSTKIISQPDITKASLKQVAFKDILGFQKDNLDTALEIFKKDCKARKVNKVLKNVCKKSTNYNNGYEFFTSNFIAFNLLNKDETNHGLITGYYEPILKGSFTKSDIYKYPIYKTPKDLITVRLSSIYPELKKYTLRGKIKNNKLIPYENRAQLLKNDSKLEPLLYVDNKIDKFFLEIQGSGKVILPNKKIINIGYAQQNGRKYYAVGKKLIQNGEIKKENMSLQSIRQWCELNPNKIDELFNLNDSVIFFHLSKNSATGSLGVPLVAKRNIAVDKSYIPLGFPVFINTSNPITNKKINSLMVAADTGGAIKGEIRADFFWGNGVNAKLYAGKMAQKGILTILIPKETINKKNQGSI